MKISQQLLLVVLVGCGRDSPAKPGHESPAGQPAENHPPCQYMARADAEAAVGLALPGTTEKAELGMCDYTTPEFYGASLTVGDWQGIKGAATSGGPNHQPTAITGVGDEALNLTGHLYVRKGDRGFLLSLNGPPIDHLPDHGLERAKVLARTIVPKL